MAEETIRQKILIVEDEMGIANVFKKQLELIGGFSVSHADGGQKALDMLKENQYDLILLDLVMPEVDGIAVMKELYENSKQYKTAPIIVLTNVTSEITERNVAKYGVKEYIVKTDVEPDVLIKKIREVIAESRREK